MAYYSPGTEPESLKKRINTLFEKLDAAYPDKIVSGLHKEHKKWGEALTKLYRECGYQDGRSFLEAYGYKYEAGIGGRPQSVDPAAIIEELQKKYPNGSPFKSANELFTESGYGSNFKTVSNNSNKIFGMPLNKYLLSIGLIQPKTKAKKKNYIICKVLLTAVKDPVYYISGSKTIHEGDMIEVPVGIYDIPVFGVVREVIGCDEDSAPCDVSKAKTITRKLGVREYEKGRLSSILHAYAAAGTDDLVSAAVSSAFSGTECSPLNTEGEISWACCRGLASYVIQVLEHLMKKDAKTYKYKDLIIIEPGISELYIYCDDVKDVMNRFPDVKMVMFSENSVSGMADLCYSRSGYPFITDTYTIGSCDTESSSKWTLKNSPTEDFTAGGINYTFKFRDDWECLNYVFSDESKTRRQLGKRD